MNIPQKNIEYFGSFKYELKHLPKYDIGKTIQFLKRAKVWVEGVSSIGSETEGVSFIETNVIYDETVNYQTLSFEVVNTVFHFQKIVKGLSTSTYRFYLETKKQIQDYALLITNLELAKTHSFKQLRSTQQEIDFKLYEDLTFDLVKFEEKLEVLRKEKRKLEKLIAPGL